MNLSRKSLIFFRNFFPLLLALLTCLIGYIGIYFYSSYQGKNFNKETSYTIVNQLDNLFISLQTTSKAISPLINISDKTDIQHILNTIIETIPTIKAINILKDKQTYYSSADKEDEKANLEYVNKKMHDHPLGKLFIVFNQTSTLYIEKTTESTVVITLKNSVLTDILKPHIPTQFITLNLDNSFITYQGIVSEPPLAYKVVKATSTNNFPYTLETGFYKPINLEVLAFYHGTSFIIISLLAVMIYIVSRWIIENLSGSYFELDRAIRNNEIKAYVQPVYSAKERKVIGIEVLARWHHPIIGTILPDIFIPLAEQTGLVIAMTKQLFKQVGIAIAPYAKRIETPFKIGFNISRVHCQNLDLVDDCKKFYDYLGTRDITLIIEITERELIEVTDITKELFKELHKLNAQIALDDFGIGNSNLSYLYDFSVDYLKIDKSFVSRFGSDALSKNILDSIIEIAQNCQLESCAEGVESEFQADYLSNRGVNYLQGFYFSKPIPLQEFLNSLDFRQILK